MKLKKNRRQVFNDYLEVVEAAWETGIRPRCHLEDLTRADINGFVMPFVCELVKRSEQVAPEMHAKVRLCDTMGFGVSYPGVSLPRSIPKLTHRLNHARESRMNVSSGMATTISTWCMSMVELPGYTAAMQ